MDSEEPMEQLSSGCGLITPVLTESTTQTPALDLKGSDTATVHEHPQHHSPQYAQQISMAEYREQSAAYTQHAVRELKASPEYKKHTQQCHSCGCSWYGGGWGEGCRECGGYAMRQPCPICAGQCGRNWTRNVDMSHRMGEAYWDGECGLSEQQQAALMCRRFVHPDEQQLSEALEDL